MVWSKEIGASGGADGGWRGDFPLDHELPGEIAVDCQRLRLPIHPMFFVRLRVFADWHRAEGRQVEIVPPTEPQAKQVFEEMEADLSNHSSDENDAVVAVSRLQEFGQVEAISARTKEILEYQLIDVSVLGEATFMAVSELCGNAIDHGANPLGAYVAVRRVTEPRRQVSIAIPGVERRWVGDSSRHRGTHHGHRRSSPGFRVLLHSGIRFDDLPSRRTDEFALRKRLLPNPASPRTAEGRGFSSSQI